jgi:hypothetical protein
MRVGITAESKLAQPLRPAHRLVALHIAYTGAQALSRWTRPLSESSIWADRAFTAAIGEGSSMVFVPPF